MPELVLTRPAAQAVEWAARLQTLGVRARSRPLIETRPLTETQAEARRQAQAANWVFFTSTAAVQALFDGSRFDWPAAATALCVGPGTAAALRGRGVERLICPPADAVQFDSEALWPLLQPQLSGAKRVLWLRGDGGRDWLIERLRAAGATVDLLTVYHRSAPLLSPREATELQAWLADPTLVWLFSSSEAVQHLATLATVPWAQLRALATHPRIAATLAERGCRATEVSPTAEAVATRFLESSA